MLVRYAKRLGQLIVAQGQRGEEYNENLGRYVAAAFIAMERLDSALASELMMDVAGMG